MIFFILFNRMNHLTLSQASSPEGGLCLWNINTFASILLPSVKCVSGAGSPGLTTRILSTQCWWLVQASRRYRGKKSIFHPLAIMHAAASLKTLEKRQDEAPRSDSPRSVWERKIAIIRLLSFSTLHQGVRHLGVNMIHINADFVSGCLKQHQFPLV